MKLNDYAAELVRGQEAMAAADSAAKLDAVQANAEILAVQLEQAAWAPGCRQQAASLAADFRALARAANEARCPLPVQCTPAPPA